MIYPDRANGIRLVTDPVANVTRKVTDLHKFDTLADGRIVDHIRIVAHALVRVYFTNERHSTAFAIGDSVTLMHP